MPLDIAKLQSLVTESVGVAAQQTPARFVRDMEAAGVMSMAACSLLVIGEWT